MSATKVPVTNQPRLGSHHPRAHPLRRHHNTTTGGPTSTANRPVHSNQANSSNQSNSPAAITINANQISRGEGDKFTKV